MAPMEITVQTTAATASTETATSLQENACATLAFTGHSKSTANIQRSEMVESDTRGQTFTLMFG